MIFGGYSQKNENPVFVPEMFDPENESQGWVNLPAATVLDYTMAQLYYDRMVAYLWLTPSQLNRNCELRFLGQAISFLQQQGQQYLVFQQ